MVFAILAQYADPILMAGGFVFAATLVPTAIDPEAKVPVTTSVPTAITLYVFTLTYISISFILTATSMGLSALVWTFIAWKRRPENEVLLSFLKQ